MSEFLAKHHTLPDHGMRSARARKSCLPAYSGTISPFDQPVELGPQIARTSMTYGPDLGQQPIPGVHRTPDEQFATVDDFPFAPHYLDIDGLRMHCIDEGSAQPALSYSCMASRCGVTCTATRSSPWRPPDTVSSRRTTSGLARATRSSTSTGTPHDHHVLTLKTLVTRLDLRGITIVVNDWGGPTG